MRAAGEIEVWLTEWLAAALGCSAGEVDPTHTFARFGLASVQAVGLVGALEEWLGEPVDEAACYRWPTPRELAAALAGTTPVAARAEPRAVAQDSVVVVGLSCRFPGGATDPESFWGALAAGVDAVTDVPAERWDVDRYYDPDRRVPSRSYTRRGAFLPDVAGFDAEFFGFSPQEAVRTDPQQRLLLELVWEALEDGGIAASALRGSRTGLIVGLMDTGQYARVQLDAQGGTCHADPYFGQGCASSVAAGRVAHRLDLRGPAFTVDTACSSSLVATHLAAQSLLRGESDLALAAGVALNVHPSFHIQACAMSMLAPDGQCKTFDERADGFAMGEGGGVVVLERMSDALRNGHRIHAVLRGSAVNQDGHSNGLTAPNGAAQVAVVRAALAAAGVPADQVDYLEAHGSGTRLGDAIELSALHEVFGARPADRPLWIGAVKTNLGHTLAAAGMAGLLKAILALRHAQLPPNLHLDRPTGALPGDGTVRPLAALTPFPGDRRIAGVSSFGWSGTNAHVVLERAPDAPEPAEGLPWQVLTLSAATGPALAEQAERLAKSLRDNTSRDLADVAYTLQTGRSPLAVRRAVVCRDTEDAVRRLADRAEFGEVPSAGPNPPRVAFLLPGVGDQYPGLGRRLYETEPVFAEAFDECASLLSVDLTAQLLAARPSTVDLFGAAGAADRTELAHPYVFAVEIALARLLRSWGVRPDALLGYSLGEYTAACLAGVFSLPDAVRIVAERARLIARCPAGAMLAIAAGEAETRELLAAVGGGVTVAALNGPAMTVVGGSREPVEAVRAEASRRGLAGQLLRTTHAFHSGLLEPVRDELRALIAATDRRPPEIPVVSNVTGTWLSAEQAMDPDYWADHLCRPVRFADGARLLTGVDALVEVGPGATLGSLVRQNAAAPTAVLTTLPSAMSTAGERETVQSALGTLWELGAEVDWSAIHHGRRALVDLPTYPFQRSRFWPEPTVESTVDETAADGEHWCYAPRWTRDAARPEPLARDASLLVFTDQHGIGARLAQLGRKAGLRATEVVTGTAFHADGPVVTIDPTRPEHYRAVLDRCPGPVSVVHAWSLRTPSLTGSAEAALRSAIRDGFDTLLLLIKALGERTGEARLLTVSAGSADVLGDDLVAPERAIVHGFGLVVPAEYPEFRWSGVDLDPTRLDRPGEQAGHLLDELGTPPAADGMAAWRRGRRWTRTWARTDQSHVDGLSWRPDGAYLITGGTRGLGLAVARHLVGIGVRRLALVARTPVPDGEESVTALRAEGAEVLTLTADAGEPDQLRAAIRLARQRFGTLTGVVHAAGVPGAGVIQRKDPARAVAVLAPKVLGVAPLLELVGEHCPPGERLETLVLFSSSVTALGGLGESDYCAANTVLDAAAGWAGASGRVVSVAWGPWQHDAWQSTTLSGIPRLAERIRRYRAEFGITGEAGPALLDRILAGGESTVLALGQSLPATRRFWSGLSDLRALAGEPPCTATHPRPRLRTACVPPRTDIERRVCAVWERFLGIRGIGVEDPFFELGGNSLVGTAMVRALEKELDLPIAPAVLFQHPTVAAMARWMAGDPRANQATDGQARGEHRRTLRAGRRTAAAVRLDTRK